MDWQNWLGEYGIYWTTLLVCLAGAVIPLICTEVYLIAVSALMGKAYILPVVLIASMTHIVGKSLVYLAGRGVIKIPIRKMDSKFEKVSQRFQKWKKSPMLFIAISALSSIPPFYVVCALAGMMKYSYPRYVLSGLFGLTLRFAIFMVFPQAVKLLL